MRDKSHIIRLAIGIMNHNGQDAMQLWVDNLPADEKAVIEAWTQNDYKPEDKNVDKSRKYQP